MNFRRKIFVLICFLTVSATAAIFKYSHMLFIAHPVRSDIKWIPVRNPMNGSNIQRMTTENGSLMPTSETANIDRHSVQGVQEATVEEAVNRSGSSYLIVLYHFYHILLRGNALRSNMSKCSVYKNCIIRHEKKLSKGPIKADAIVFQGNRMPRNLPRRHNFDQVFIYANIESPQNLQFVNLANAKLQDFFNWTMSYRFDSDIPYLYGSIIPKMVSKEELHARSEISGYVYNYRDFSYMTTHWPNKFEGILGKDYEAIFMKKNKSSVWFVSHCRTASKREKFVENLKRITNVETCGHCSKRKNMCPPKMTNSDEYIQGSYKFVLAFENSLCEDYVTEKVFDRYNLDVITVVFGAHNYSKYLPEGTYINANDFETPDELARYMNYVGNNKEVYLDYLKLKDQYKAILGREHSQLAYCTLCYRLNKLNEYRKPGSPLRQWWNRRGICRKPKIINSKPQRPRKKVKK